MLNLFSHGARGSKSNRERINTLQKKNNIVRRDYQKKY